MTGYDFFPIGLSLRVATAAIVLVVPPGIAIAWLQARRRYRMRAAVDSTPRS